MSLHLKETLIKLFNEKEGNSCDCAHRVLSCYRREVGNCVCTAKMQMISLRPQNTEVLVQMAC